MAIDEAIPLSILIMPYVQENISNPVWRCQEAATYAFGSIIEGSSLEKLAPLVNMALNFILNALKDENNQVKDTTTWTLGRIEFLHGPTVQSLVITPTNLQSIVASLLESIKDAPNVADKICGALYFLAQGYEQVNAASCPLSPFLPDLIGSLLATTERKDAADSRIRYHVTVGDLVVKD